MGQYPAVGRIRALSCNRRRCMMATIGRFGGLGSADGTSESGSNVHPVAAVDVIVGGNRE